MTTITFVLAPILTLNLAESVARFPLDEGADAGRITTVGVTVLALSSVVGLLIMPVSQLFESVADYAVLIYRTASPPRRSPCRSASYAARRSCVRWRSPIFATLPDRAS